MITPYLSHDEAVSAPSQPDPGRRRALRCLLGGVFSTVLGVPLVAGAARTRSNGFSTVSGVDDALFPRSAGRFPSLREAVYYRPLDRGESDERVEARVDPWA